MIELTPSEAFNLTARNQGWGFDPSLLSCRVDRCQIFFPFTGHFPYKFQLSLLPDYRQSMLIKSEQVCFTLIDLD